MTVSTTYISVGLRRLVVSRADRLCEYCLLHEDDAYFGCEVDHIISEKHGGATDEMNLAYACMCCNRSKGSDIGSIVIPLSSNIFSRFFNPRIDLWHEHFILDNEIVISPLSNVGEVTARIFGFNSIERLLERQTLYEIDRYLTPEALRYIGSN
jgi:HNH endonuclease